MIHYGINVEIKPQTQSYVFHVTIGLDTVKRIELSANAINQEILATLAIQPEEFSLGLEECLKTDLNIMHFGTRGTFMFCRERI